MNLIGIDENGKPVITQIDSKTSNTSLADVFTMLSHEYKIWSWTRTMTDQPYKVLSDNSLENILSLLYHAIDSISKEAVSEHDKEEVSRFLKSLKD